MGWVQEKSKRRSRNCREDEPGRVEQELRIYYGHASCRRQGDASR